MREKKNTNTSRFTTVINEQYSHYLLDHWQRLWPSPPYGPYSAAAVPVWTEKNPYKRYKHATAGLGVTAHAASSYSAA